jgi:hypothetical protein
MKRIPVLLGEVGLRSVALTSPPALIHPRSTNSGAAGSGDAGTAKRQTTARRIAICFLATFVVIGSVSWLAQAQPSTSVCGITSDCPSGYHPAAFFCDPACGGCPPGDNAIRCERDVGPPVRDVWMAERVSQRLSRCRL